MVDFYSKSRWPLATICFFFRVHVLKILEEKTFFSFLASRLYLVSVDCVHSEKTPLRGVDDDNKPSDGDDKAEVAEQTSLTIIK